MRVDVTLPEIVDLWADDAPDRDGRATAVYGGDHHWQHRHSEPHRTDGQVGAQVCVASERGWPRFQCQCRANGAPQCCEHANAEDMRCEPCRRWCS